MCAPSAGVVSSEEVADLLLVVWQKWRLASPVRRGAITREQYWVLRILSERGPMRIKDLASAIGTTVGSTSVAMKRLERAGMVTRKRSDKDERVVTVSLGRRGVAMLEAWKKEQLASVAGLFESLGPGERRTLRGLLSKALRASGELQPLQAREGRGL